MEIKKKDLLRLHNAITMLEEEKYSIKFSYFLAKNKVVMSNEITALEEVNKMSDEYQAFENERMRLAQLYADKNEDGTAKVDGDNFVITENAADFRTEFETIINENQDVINSRGQQLKELNEILVQTTEFIGTKINLDDIPQSIEPWVMECFILADLIIE